MLTVGYKVTGLPRRARSGAACVAKRAAFVRVWQPRARHGKGRVGPCLAIWVGPRIDPEQLYRAKQTLEVALDVDIDLIDLAAANTGLRLEVVRDGKLLHQHGNEQALAFEARVLGDYAELMDATREIRESIRKRGTVYAI